jgi:hypothetical protein
MGCGCKKKKAAARAANTPTTDGVVVDGQLKSVRPPEVLKPPPREANVNEIVDKLNKILSD